MGPGNVRYSVGDTYSFCNCNSGCTQRITLEQSLARVAVFGWKSIRCLQGYRQSQPSTSQEQQTVVQQIFRLPTECRAGANGGNMVAGVIGSDRLQYDLWGDNVSWWSPVNRWAMYRLKLIVCSGYNFKRMEGLLILHTYSCWHHDDDTPVFNS